MKKLLICALAAFTMLGAGCSKDPAVSEITAEQGGTYRLTTLSATLDDQDTRTSLGNNSVVNWSNNDRIAVVNLKTNVISYYVLTSGVGTSVGKFEPVNTAAPARFDDLADIKAVYPAIAAQVADGKLSLSLNKEYTEAERVKGGLTSWTQNSSAYAFTNNDIKVSYRISADFASNDADAKVNFKFRQLATWCSFVFDFTASDKGYDMENMESIRVTTTSGKKMISGTAEVDFTDPNQPVLKEGTEAAIEWKTIGTLSSPTLTKSLMLFPVVDGDQLKIEVSTNLHTFTFYATPVQAFVAGTILRFPINVDSNFEQTNETKDFAYSVTEKELDPFYFYGEANCLLLADETSGTLDVTPRKTNVFYWVDGDPSADVSGVAKPRTAKVIWREAGITSMAEPTVTANGNKYTLNIADVQGYGNALVGIYDADDNLLWSYHIWKTEIDPRETLRYEYTNSGAYDVMPIALGATAKVDIGPTETATANTLKTYGLYYQWGRKDPLGRSANLANNNEMVTTYSDATGTTPYTLKDKNTSLVTLLGGINITEKEWEYSENNKKMLPVDSWMVNYVTAHPTEFIVSPDGNNYDNDWVGKTNNYLWGNPQGYESPRHLQHRSIFDPCPAGYRVAPSDLWVVFTDNGSNRGIILDDEDAWPNILFNILNLSADGKTTTMITQHGYFFCYGTNADGSKKWQQEPADFYPANGFRNRTNGSLVDVGSDGYAWSSAPFSAGSSDGGRLHFNSNMLNPLSNRNRAYGLALRCVKEK